MLNVFVLIVATLHLWFMTLEMFLWTTPIGLKVFKQTIEKAQETKVLAANQGLYNGFLAAGLIYSFLVRDAGAAFHLRAFCFSCVVVAGLYGAATVSVRILLMQSVPAAIGLVLLFI